MFRYVLLVCSLQLCAQEEVALILRNEDGKSLSLERRFEILQNQVEGTLEAKSEQLRSLLKEHLRESKRNEQAHLAQIEELKTQIAYLTNHLDTIQNHVDETVMGIDENFRTLVDAKITALDEKIASNPDLVAFSLQKKQPTETPPEKPVIAPPPAPAYAPPARVEVSNSYNVWTQASFTYWQPSQDNMEVGALSNQISEGHKAFDTFILTGDQYQAGFKVGTGIKFDRDKWDLGANYTWFRGTNTVNKTVPPSPAYPLNYYQIWPIPGQIEVLSDAQFTNLHSDWRLHFDLIDLVLGRWQHLGAQLICCPFAGLRSAFIRQNKYVKYTHFLTPPPVSSVGPIIETRQSSNSWAIGPELGLNLNWMLFPSLKILTSFEADILYTQYTRLHDTTTATADTVNPRWISNTENNLNCVRAHLDMMIGLGWGTHSRCNRYYFNVEAAYEFQVFFDQNVFHSYFNDTSPRQGLSTVGNLYLQGLTATASFHF